MCHRRLQLLCHLLHQPLYHLRFHPLWCRSLLVLRGMPPTELREIAGALKSSHPGVPFKTAGRPGLATIQRPYLAELQGCPTIVSLVLSLRRNEALVAVPGFLVGIQGEADWLKSLAGLVHSPTSWVELEEVAVRWKPGRMRVPG
jgi:hypothetical protein